MTQFVCFGCGKTVPAKDTFVCYNCGAFVCKDCAGKQSELCPHCFEGLSRIH